MFGGIIINLATGVHQFIFSLLGAGIGFSLTFLVRPYNLLDMIFFSIFGFLITLFLLNLVLSPLFSIIDTLLVSFVEFPERIEVVAGEIKNDLVNLYDTQLQKKISLK